jgi:glutamate--cysteine ligase catalytic subunit
MRFAMLLLLGVCIESAILRTGTPLRWNDALNSGALSYVRRAGVTQFLSHYHKSRLIETPSFLWGDEIEYGVFGRSAATGHMDLRLRGAEIIEQLARLETERTDPQGEDGCDWQPEYGSWMVEAVPRLPYGGYVSDLHGVERSLQRRRRRIHAALAPGEVAPSMSVFPMLGVSGYAHAADAFGPISNSSYVSDAVINNNPRFGALTQNIRLRRQSNVNISVPLASGGGSAHMDAMAFGMGCCCLQITMQCRNEQESRFLHDQLAVGGSPCFETVLH